MNQSIRKLEHTNSRQCAYILSSRPIRSQAIYENFTNWLDLPANYPNLPGTSSRWFPVFAQPWCGVTLTSNQQIFFLPSNH